MDILASASDASDPARRRSRPVPEEKMHRITFEDLQSCFHLPLAEVARSFGVGTTFMKKHCRLHGIKRWPFRKVRSQALRRQSGNEEVFPWSTQTQDMPSQLSMGVDLAQLSAGGSAAQVGSREEHPRDPVQTERSVEDVACGVLAALCHMSQAPIDQEATGAPKQERTKQQAKPPPPPPPPPPPLQKTETQNCQAPTKSAMPYTISALADVSYRRPAHPYGFKPLPAAQHGNYQSGLKAAHTSTRCMVKIS